MKTIENDYIKVEVNECGAELHSIVRKSDGYGHQAIVKDPIRYEFTGDAKADDYNVTLKMTQEVEKIIKEYPDNWIWFQHRWNTPYTPPEEAKQLDE